MCRACRTMLLPVALLLAINSHSASAQILQMIREKLGTISAIADTSEASWIGSTTGLYAAGRTGTLALIMEQPISGVAALGDDLWVSTDTSCYVVSPLRPNVIVSKENVRITAVPGITGRLVRVHALPKLAVAVITTDGGFLWTGSGAANHAVSETDIRSSVATADGRFVFIASPMRLYRIAADGGILSASLPNINSLAILDHELLIGRPSSVDACLFDLALDSCYHAHVGTATALVPAEQVVYASTRQGLYALRREDSTARISSVLTRLASDGNVTPAVHQIAVRDNWIVAAREGAEPVVYIYDNNSLQPLGFPGPSGTINAVAVESGVSYRSKGPGSPATGPNTAPHTFGAPKYIYVATDNGLYTTSPTSPDRKWTRVAPSIDIQDVRVSGSTIWAISSAAVFRFRRDVRITVDLTQVSPTLSESILGGVFSAAGVRLSGNVKPVIRYVSAGGETLEAPPLDLTLIRSDDVVSELDIQKRRNADVYVPAPSGTTMKYFLRDEWGNEIGKDDNGNVVGKPIAGRFYPQWIVSGAAVALLWVVALCLLVAFAPISLVVNALLMNRYIRHYGFFNFIPVLAVFTPIRRHLLRRYLTRLGEEVPPDARYVIPSDSLTPARILQRTHRDHFLYIRGESGIGKTALVRNVLRTTLASNTDHIPVVISLRQQRASEPSAAVAAQLQSYGKVTDADLAAELLKHGSFLFVFDGLNEVTENGRDLINAFVASHKGSSSFLFTSQVDFQDVEGPRLVMERFDEGKVQEFLSKRLDGERAKVARKQVSDSTMSILGVPQELEMFARVIEQGRRVEPLTRLGLYDAVTKPVLEQLERRGKSYVWNALAERAYQATTAAQPVDFTDVELREATGPLQETGLLVQSGNDLLFRHEQVQGYLASIHFTPRWRDILQIHAEEKSTATDRGEAHKQSSARPGYRWLPMLRFTLSRLSSVERAELLEELAHFDSRLAEDVNRSWSNDVEAPRPVV